MNCYASYIAVSMCITFNKTSLSYRIQILTIIRMSMRVTKVMKTKMTKAMKTTMTKAMMTEMNKISVHIWRFKSPPLLLHLIMMT